MAVSLLGLLVLLLIVVPLFFAAAYRAFKGQWWPLTLLVLVPVLFVALSYSNAQRAAEHAQRLIEAETAKIESISEARRNQVTVAEGIAVPERPQRSTAELWQELTEAKINLDTEVQEAQSETKGEPASAGDETEAKKPIVVSAPHWVETPPKPIGNVFRVVVESDPFTTEDECYDQLEEVFRAKVRERLVDILPADQSKQVGNTPLADIGIPLSFIMRDICRESYTESLDSSVGPMERVHVLMEFDSDVEQQLRTRWVAYQRQAGLSLVTKVAALIFCGLAVLYALLQIDTWTRGYYSKRLLVGVPVAIIAVALLLFV